MGMMSFKSLILLILTATCPSTGTTNFEWETETSCVNVLTSKGLRTLQHSQAACAPLQLEEPESNEGLQYLRCYLGKVYYRICLNNTRYDVETGTCTNPYQASCDIPDSNGASNTRTKRSTYRGPCTKENCKLPKCFCSGDTPSMPSSDMPMFVMVTFDDSVHNDLFNKFFRPMFVDNKFQLYNPSGCPIKMGLYVSYQWSNATLVQEAYHAGNEIGSHTLFHELPEGENETYAAMTQAIVGVKWRLLEATGDRALYESIVGFRTPYLKCSGDIKYDVLKDHGFLYDSSITNSENFYGRVPFWPYTFNYFPKSCTNCDCPAKRYKGLWQVPLNAWLGEDGKVCSMVDGWTFDKEDSVVASRTVNQWYNYYHRHFLNYFYPYKVPMPYFSHGYVFFRSPNSYIALRRWLRDLLHDYPNVWVVPPKMVINWMQHPLTHSEMKANKWDCSVK